jgi:opacity protein-like surface antigen
MKKIGFLMVMAFMAISNVTFAQFMNTSSMGSSNGFHSWKAFVIEYNNLDFDGDEATGITVGVNTAKNFASNSALFFEYGLNLQYAFEKDGDYKFNMLTAKVPLNLLYAFEIDNNVIAPFVGLPLNAHILGKVSYDDYEVNVFSSDDMDDEQWTRFQIGWNIGVKAFLGEKFIGTVSYGSSINDLADYGGQVETFTIGVGFRF